MPLPDSPTVTLPENGRYLLVSDAHLGDGGRTDLFGGNDAVFLSMLDNECGDVDAVILNGDILDAAQAGVADNVRQAHPAVLECLEALAARIPVYYVLGNHDTVEFVQELLPTSRQVDSVGIGESAIVVHGHQLDKHFREGKLSSRSFFALQAHARVEQWTSHHIRLPFGDHDNPTNRFAHWAFYRYTMAVHRFAQGMILLGKADGLRRWAAHHDYWSRSQWGDSHALLIPALAALAEGPYRVLITGHVHQAGVLEDFSTPPAEQVSGEPDISWRPKNRRAPNPEDLRGKLYANLGSWTFLEATYGRWENNRITVRDWRTGAEIGDKTYQVALTASEIPGMREWWRKYYRGFFRYDTERVRRDRAHIQM